MALKHFKEGICLKHFWKNELTKQKHTLTFSKYVCLKTNDVIQHWKLAFSLTFIIKYTDALSMLKMLIKVSIRAKKKLVESF